jgi:23S rRNA (cytosine1962-C5)-methyltransferase
LWRRRASRGAPGSSGATSLRSGWRFWRAATASRSTCGRATRLASTWTSGRIGPAWDNAAKDVLDAFSYSGAFGVCAAAGGAKSATLVDTSAPALDLARRNFELNGLQAKGIEYVEGDVFSVLRGYRAQGRGFDVIVLDPPKLARSDREVKRASRAYKDANLLAFQLLQPGGILFTFSCSGAVSADLLQKIVFSAAVDAGRDGQIIAHLSQGADHPVALTFPEGAYLKGLICRVV